MKAKLSFKLIGMIIVLFLGAIVLSCDKQEFVEPVSQDEMSLQLKCADIGCTLTPGYWKTHSENGPAPYDETWALLPDAAATPFFLSGQTYYQVLWTSPAGNAYYILAHQYIAAELNELNGASFSAAQDAFDAAMVLFNTYTPAQAAVLKGQDKTEWTNLAMVLDNYNNGLIGPGHCPE